MIFDRLELCPHKNQNPFKGSRLHQIEQEDYNAIITRDIRMQTRMYVHQECLIVNCVYICTVFVHETVWKH